MRKVTAILKRGASTDQGTFGTFTFPGFFAYSLELPWRDNKPNVSCIPKGTYKCVWEYSPKYKRKMYGIYTAEGRKGLRIHSGNLGGDVTKGYVSHINGCILLAYKVGYIGKQKAVLVSRPAVRKLEQTMNKQTFTLEII